MQSSQRKNPQGSKANFTPKLTPIPPSSVPAVVKPVKVESPDKAQHDIIRKLSTQPVKTYSEIKGKLDASDVQTLPEAKLIGPSISSQREVLIKPQESPSSHDEEDKQEEVSPLRMEEETK